MRRSTLPQLAAFALVAEEYERSGDAVRGLKPLFAAALSAQAGRQFAPDEFAKAFSELFGVSMGPHVARSLKAKLVEIGLLSQEGSGAVVSPELAGRALQGSMDVELRAVLDAFVTWSSHQLLQKGFEFEAEELQAEFLQRLARPEFAAGFFDEDDAERTARLKAQIFSDTALRGKERDGVFDFLAAKFIAFAYSNARDVFDSMALVSSGALIAEAIAGLASPSEFRLPKDGLRVVVDGPLLLDYLDLNTPEQNVYARAMLNELRDSGFMLATFDHVIEEMRLLINSALKEYAAGREYGPLGDRLRSESGFSTYAALVRDSIQQRLENELGISVLRFELYDRGDREKYFSAEQIDYLFNALGDPHHQVERRERDAKSIAGVIRLKKENRRPTTIFGAGTIFLTRNSRLAKDATRFLAIGRSEADPRYAVVLDSQLLPIIWFAKGAAEKFAEMSRQRLIANCAAAMLPQREVVHKIADFLSSINPTLKEEFSALMSDERAKLCPMNVTLGISSTINEQAARELVERMKAALVEPVLEEVRAKEAIQGQAIRKLEEEADRARSAVFIMQGTVAKFDEDLAQAFLDRDRHAAEVAESKRLIEQFAAAKESQAIEIESSCESCANRIRKGVALFLWVLVVCSTVYATISGDAGGYIAVAGSFVGALMFGSGQEWADQIVERGVKVLFRARRTKAAALLDEARDLRASIATRPPHG